MLRLAFFTCPDKLLFIYFFSFLTFQNVNVRVLVDLALKDLTVVVQQVWSRRIHRLTFDFPDFVAVALIGGLGTMKEKLTDCFLLPLLGCVLGSKV